MVKKKGKKKGGKNPPDVGLEPTAVRLKAARSTSWANQASDEYPKLSLWLKYVIQKNALIFRALDK